MSSKAIRYFFAIALRTRQRGYCWARNPNLTKLFQVDRRTIARWNKILQSIGLITVEIIGRNDRHIHLTAEGAEMAARIEAEKAPKSPTRCRTESHLDPAENGTIVPPLSHSIRSSESVPSKNLKRTTTGSQGRAPRPPRPASPPTKSPVVSAKVLDLDGEEILAELKSAGVAEDRAVVLAKNHKAAARHNLAAVKVLVKSGTVIRNIGGWLNNAITNNLHHSLLAEEEKKKAAAIKCVAETDDATEKARAVRRATLAQIEALDADAKLALKQRAAASLGTTVDGSPGLIEARMIAIANGSHDAKLRMMRGSSS